MRYFKPGEMECKCGKCGLGVDDMEPLLLLKLDAARQYIDDNLPPGHGISFVINSAVRCPEHNEAVGGSTSSSHLPGYAVDVKANSSRLRHWVLKSLYVVDIGRIGIGRDFIHADVDPDKDPEVAWLY